MIGQFQTYFVFYKKYISKIPHNFVFKNVETCTVTNFTVKDYVEI